MANKLFWSNTIWPNFYDPPKIEIIDLKSHHIILMQLKKDDLDYIVWDYDCILFRMFERMRNASSAPKETKLEMKNEPIHNREREELFVDIDDVNMRDIYDAKDIDDVNMLDIYDDKDIDDVNMIDRYLNSFDETLFTDENIIKQPHF